MLALLTVVLIAQARVQPIPACQPNTFVQVGESRSIKGRPVSQTPAVAGVKAGKITGLAVGWAELKGAPKGEPSVVCVYEGKATEHCGLCGLPLSVKFDSTVELVGEYPDLDGWKKVHAISLRTGLRAPPAPLAFAEKVVEVANAALADASVAPRLTLVAAMPVLDPLPKDDKESAAASAALAAHLPLLLELLAR